MVQEPITTHQAEGSQKPGQEEENSMENQSKISKYVSLGNLENNKNNKNNIFKKLILILRTDNHLVLRPFIRTNSTVLK